MDKVAELKAEYEKAMETYNAENGEVFEFSVSFWVLNRALMFGLSLFLCK